LDILSGGLKGASPGSPSEIYCYILSKLIYFFVHFFVIKSLGLASALDQDSSKKFGTTNNANKNLKHCFSSFKVRLD
jgi:hypothetical protein